MKILLTPVTTVTREQRSKMLGKLADMANADMKCCYTSCTRCSTTRSQARPSAVS